MQRIVTRDNEGRNRALARRALRKSALQKNIVEGVC